jgi:hypothetical protein
MTYTTKTVIIDGKPVTVKVYPAHAKTPRSKSAPQPVDVAALPEHLRHLAK